MEDKPSLQQNYFTSDSESPETLPARVPEADIAAENDGLSDSLNDGDDQEPDSENDELELAESEEDQAPLKWQASEYIHHQKRPVWYLVLFVIVGSLLATGVLTHQWSGLVVLVAMTVAVLVYSNKAPRVLNYSLSDAGITIEEKFFSYEQFKAFSVISDVAWHTIDLDPVKRFSPRLTILFDDKDFEAIVGALSNELPRNDRQPDVVERLTRFLKF